MMPRVGCLYAPDLPAWTHAQLHGRRRHLVVIERGRVAGVSRAARRRGVVEGMATERARALLPEEATLAPRRQEQEAATWETACAAVNRVTPRLENVRPGLLYFEPLEEASVRQMAVQLKLQGAVALDRPTALLAVVRATPGHVLTVTAAKRGAFLARYRTRLLSRLGFEEEMTRRLELFGFEHLGPMRRLTKRHLTAQFGQEGTRLYELLHPGRAARVAYYQAPPTVRASYDIEEWLGGMQPVRLVLEETARRAVAELKGRRAQRLAVAMELRGGAAVLRQVRVLPGPTGETGHLSRIAVRLLEELAQREAFTEAGGLAALAGLEIELGYLRHPETRQGALFARRPGVEAAVKAVHRRFPGALLSCRLRPHALFPEERSEFAPLGVPAEE